MNHIRQGTIDEPQREADGDVRVIRHALDGGVIRDSLRQPHTIEIHCVSGNRLEALKAALKRLQDDGPDR
jgi:hypothetical protein